MSESGKSHKNSLLEITTRTSGMRENNIYILRKRMIFMQAANYLLIFE
jgi:hypothetical protein